MDISTMLLLLCAVGASLIGLVNSTSYCEDTPYKMEDSICCGKKLQPRGVTSRCCEETGEVYNARNQICCGTVQDVQQPWTRGCCTNGAKATLYNTSRQTCCHGNIHDTKRQITLRNGDIIEDDIYGFCCGQKFVDAGYDGHDISCCRNTDEEALSKPYNRTQNMCCAGSVQPLTATGRCCGQLTYDSYEENCCFPNNTATIIPAIGKGPNKCCAKAPAGVIDESTHVCHNDHPYERECFSAAYNTVSSATLGCCHGFNYNKTTHHCCGYRVLPRDTVCCAGQPVQEGQVCCGPDHGAKTVSHPTHNSCCYTAASTQTYDNTTHKCRYGMVKLRSMCRGKPFNPAKEICCEGELYQRMSGWVCCGNRLFTPKYLTCCAGRRLQGANRTCK